MTRYTVVAATLLLALALTPAAQADDITCTPLEVSVFPERVHVRCTTAVGDGGDSIIFWAVSTADADNANRFITLATTALVAGRDLVLGYTPGDTSGTVFGCGANNCRVPWKISLF